MTTTRTWAALAAATILSSGCGLVCDAEEQRTVTFSTDPTFQIQRPGDAFSASLAGSLNSYDNDPDFGACEEEVVRYWCDRSDIVFLGRADIGHDADNRVVPFNSR